MDEDRLSCLLLAILDSPVGHVSERHATQRYGNGVVDQAKALDLVNVDDGTLWDAGRVLHITRAGRVWALGGRELLLHRKQPWDVEWLRAALGLRPMRHREL